MLPSTMAYRINQLLLGVIGFQVSGPIPSPGAPNRSDLSELFPHLLFEREIDPERRLMSNSRTGEISRKLHRQTVALQLTIKMHIFLDLVA